MAFNINEFKSEVSSKGLMRTHNFQVLMNPPAQVPNSLSLKELAFKTETVQIPGLGFLKSDNIKHYGIGPIYDKPYNVVQTDIVCTHLVESDGKMLEFFEEWMNYIVQFKRPNGLMNSTTYTMNYHDDYVTDMDIAIFDHTGAPKKYLKVFEAYPTAMDPVQIGWGQNDELMKLSVSYKFIDWHYIV
jgi:hypothetical protein